jgi:hypothetical protein
MVESCVPKPSLNNVAAADENCEVASVANHEPKLDVLWNTSNRSFAQSVGDIPAGQTSRST